MNWKGKCQLLFAATLLFLTAQVQATTMLQLDLGELTARAGKIFRGTVIDVEQGMVEEMVKGQPTLTKGEKSEIVLRMVGSIKSAVTSGDMVKLDAFRDVPKLEMGSDYLLFTTAESAAGLSVTVGLGQGAFRIVEMDRQDYAVNAFNNVGLGLDGSGPVPYSELSAKIRALLGQ